MFSVCGVLESFVTDTDVVALNQKVCMAVHGIMFDKTAPTAPACVSRSHQQESHIWNAHSPLADFGARVASPLTAKWLLAYLGCEGQE